MTASLNLAALLELAGELPAYRQLLDVLKQESGANNAIVTEAAKPFVIAALWRSLKLPVIVITAQPENARKLQEQITAWSANTQIKVFPEPDALPYERIAGDAATELERVQVLSGLKDCQPDESAAPLVIVPVAALISKVPAATDFTSSCHIIETGMTIEPFVLLSKWESMGYRMESLVEVPGTISHRGGIVDIYPPTGELPARLEFFGNIIDRIRLFDPTTQRSVRDIASLSVAPTTEMLRTRDAEKRNTIMSELDFTNCSAESREQFERELTALLEGEDPRNAAFYAPLFNDDNVLSYLPSDALLVLDEPAQIEQTINELDVEAERMRAEELAGGELPRNFPRPYFTLEELKSQLSGRWQLSLSNWGTEGTALNFTSAPPFAGQLTSFVSKVKQLKEQGDRLLIVSHQANRLSELLGDAGIIAVPSTEITHLPPDGSLTLVTGSLAEGWVMNGNTFLLTDAEIFGFVKQRRLAKRRPVARHKLFVDIAPGDYVVHIEHGIGKFTGVTAMSTTGSEKEYLVLQYAAGDRLYVPTDQIDRVNRYIGAGDKPPTLSRLGTQEWTAIKQKAKEAAAELAQELLALYASREVVPGHAFSRDTVWQQELEASFPYVETPDQMEVQREVKEDMEKTRPMDRLVCGDVGYGKTEVAVRAAFKAVMEGKQVAVLVPTTVLAEQHYVTFKQRMEAFPVRVAALSRFQSPREQNAVIAGLADGSVDICIGTHRLLQKDIVFKDLGLLIIDEEQRFGVVHKEYLKKLRQSVDVLTLSATPIPRTLHMSLVGVRDMSAMETPPEDRLPIKTYVAEYSGRIVREAILREMERNGQVFFVHNRVRSIEMVVAELRILVPEAKFAVGHGRMPPEDLEKVMTDFTRGKYEVLVCTTIIESGLDVPNANTIIINQADKLGLAQLYQLRGRVGRGGNLAYAYLLYDREKRLTSVAQKRLRTIFEATELGAGFGIAMKDLEIRGAGNLLGAKQSGHIAAVGFNLYSRLLGEAVEAQKARLAGGKEPPPRLPEPTIDLPLPSYLPEDYVADVNVRLELYQKLVKLEKPEQVDDFVQELSDRFGLLPEVVRNLLYAIRIKLLAARAGIESISTEEGQIVIRLFEGMLLDKSKLGNIINENVRAGTRQITINPKRLGNRWQGTLEEVIRRLVV
ncbi:MAG: transcription-repair coupling factor [Dehalococcoidales bacterium]|nr:transcription-repair coupling factor [Dehalococcoidales bacterium]